MSSSFVSSSSSVSPQVGRISGGRIARVGLITVLAAIVATMLVYFIGHAFVTYRPDFLALATVAPAIMFTFIAALAAVGVYAVLLRTTRRPARVFTIIAAVVFVVSLIPDFALVPTMPGATGGQTAVLLTMHFVAALVITGILTTRLHAE